MSMDTMTASARTRLAKLLALARRGEGGEQRNAERLLARALDAAGLTLNDLDGEARHPHQFRYGDRTDKELLGQVLVTVLNSNAEVPRPVWAVRRRKVFEVEVTNAERVEIDVLLSVHRAALKKELRLFFLAYVNRQSLFPVNPPAPRAHTEASELTPDEIDRACRMMGAIDRVHARRQIEGADA